MENVNWSAVVQWVVVSGLVGIVIKAAIELSRDWIGYVRRRVDAELTGWQKTFITEALEYAVKAAEQLGQTLNSTEKKAYAVDLAYRYLRQFDINVDKAVLADLVEAVVYQLFTIDAK